MLSKNHMILSEKLREPESEQLPVMALLLPVVYRHQYLELLTFPLVKNNHVINHVQPRQKILHQNLMNWRILWKNISLCSLRDYRTLQICRIKVFCLSLQIHFSLTYHSRRYPGSKIFNCVETFQLSFIKIVLIDLEKKIQFQRERWLVLQTIPQINKW